MGSGAAISIQPRTYSQDSDGDGLSDSQEKAHGFDPNIPSEAADGTLSIHPAVEVRMFTLKGQRYHLQSSPDLEFWDDVGEPFEGVGGYRSVYLPLADSELFLRLMPVTGE